jgi:hypothetical protein
MALAVTNASEAQSGGFETDTCGTSCALTVRVRRDLAALA